MEIKDNKEPTDPSKQLEELNNKEQNLETTEEKPAKRIKKQATEEQLSNPFHGVKLAQVLERIVDYYGWEYLGERTNIRCFKYNPTMKSSLGFLRKTTWAREFVEDIYLEMLDDKESKQKVKKQDQT
jgi:uncharacterized protein (DUF2132 family)